MSCVWLVLVLMDSGLGEQRTSNYSVRISYNDTSYACIQKPSVVLAATNRDGIKQDACTPKLDETSNTRPGDSFSPATC